MLIIHRIGRTNIVSVHCDGTRINVLKVHPPKGGAGVQSKGGPRILVPDLRPVRHRNRSLVGLQRDFCYHGELEDQLLWHVHKFTKLKVGTQRQIMKHETIPHKLSELRTGTRPPVPGALQQVRGAQLVGILKTPIGFICKCLGVIVPLSE